MLSSSSVSLSSSMPSSIMSFWSTSLMLWAMPSGSSPLGLVVEERMPLTQR